MRRFSKVALPAVAVFFLTGAFLGYVHIGGMPALTGTWYGGLLLAKIGAVLALIWLAAGNRRLLGETAMSGATVRRLRRPVFIHQGPQTICLAKSQSIR